MVSPLQTDVSWDGVVVTVTAAGELDIAAGRTLCHQLLEVAAARPERLVLELGGLVLADAAGARMLDRTYKLLRAGCPVVVRRPPTWSREIVGRTGLPGLRPAPAPGGDLADRLAMARAQARASYERTRKLWQRTESMMANNKMLRQEIQQTCRGWESRSPRQEVLQRSPYARLVARLETMPVIEQAKGIIMAQSACGDAEAFEMLRQASQRSNVPVRELAARLVAKSAGVTTNGAAKPRDPAAR